MEIFFVIKFLFIQIFSRKFYLYQQQNIKEMIGRKSSDHIMQEGQEIFKRFMQDGIIYVLFLKKKKAKVIGNESVEGNVFIPRTIKYEDQEFPVTSIFKFSFKYSRGIKTVEFPPDSEIKTICQEAFADSSIEKITIPPHVVRICNRAFAFCRKLQSVEIPANSELKKIEKEAFYNTEIKSLNIPASLCELDDGWCYEATNLTIIKIMPNNRHFMNIDNKMIVGKTDPKSDNYDVLVFVRRDIKNIIIPSFIKIIGSCSFSNSLIESVSIPSQVTHICEKAFCYCYKLSQIEFEKDSELTTIGVDSLSNTSIQHIVIPRHVTRICEGAFFDCSKLRCVDFQPNSELKTIESEVFFWSTIESLSIPANVVELKNGWCSCVPNLKELKIDPNNKNFKKYENIVIGKSDINNDYYDTLVFALEDEVQIPSFIKIIGAFSFCNTKLECFYLPPQITRICEGAFINCEKMTQFEIPPNSELEVIEKDAFSGSSIKRLLIPSKVSEIQDNWYSFPLYFEEMTLMPNNKHFISIDDTMIVGKEDPNSDQFDVLIFFKSNVLDFKIPKNITKIAPNAVFSSRIRSVSIPSSLKKIGKNAFYGCIDLVKVEIPADSELQAIGSGAFNQTRIPSIWIPPTVVDIDDDVFLICHSLRIIEFDENSKINSNFRCHFKCIRCIIMIPMKFRSHFE